MSAEVCGTYYVVLSYVNALKSAAHVSQEEEISLFFLFFSCLANLWSPSYLVSRPRSFALRKSREAMSKRFRSYKSALSLAKQCYEKQFGKGRIFMTFEKQGNETSSGLARAHIVPGQGVRSGARAEKKNPNPQLGQDMTLCWARTRSDGT